MHSDKPAGRMEQTPDRFRDEFVPVSEGIPATAMSSPHRRTPIFAQLTLSCSLALTFGSPLFASGAAGVCGVDDLLAGRMATGLSEAGRTPALLTDRRVLPEGAAWDTGAAVLLTAEDRPTFDLDAPLPLRSLLIQADANDAYRLEGSLDGTDFEPIAEVPKLAHLDGLRTRAIRLDGSALRFLRLVLVAGDGRASVAEIQAFCAEPGAWQPGLEVLDLPVQRAAARGGRIWNDVSSRWWELLLALAALALLAWEAKTARSAARSARASRRKLAAFAIAGGIAVLTYFNFGAFHFGNFVHGWDTFHYYLGAKYFRELGYERLYACVAVADAEEPGLEEAVVGRKLRDLRTNELGSTAGILSSPQACKSHFSAARWEVFRHDVAWFRARESADRWAAMSSDHGYNATPVWTIAGTLFANLAPASNRQILALCLLDPLYFAGLVGALWWGFGRPGASVALLVLATSFPARFYWTGGAFLRWDWLFFTVLAVCCLRRKQPLAAGMALGYAALLRVFPVLLVVGPASVALSTIAGAVRAPGGRSRISSALSTLRGPALASERRFFAGLALAVAILAPVSLAATGGLDAYRGFVTNTRKHQSTPLTNNMGLRTVVSYRPAEVGRVLHREAANDPWELWKAARIAAWDESRWFAGLVSAGALLLVARAARRAREPWMALAFGAAWIPFAVEMTSYYYAFLLVPSLLWTVRREAGYLLLSLGAASLLVSLAPLPIFPTWRDEQYTLISAMTLLALLALLAIFAFGASTVPDASAACLSPATGRAEVPRRVATEAIRNRKELRS